MAGTVRRIRTAAPRTVRASAEEFLDTVRSPNTRRAYGIAIVKTADRIDGALPSSRALASVSDTEIGDALEASTSSAGTSSGSARNIPRSRTVTTWTANPTRL